MALFPPYSTRFIAGIVKTTPATTITYTVPAGRTAVISCLTVTDIAVGAGQAGFYISPTGSVPAGYVYVFTPVSPTVIEAGSFLCHIVLEAGAAITASWIGTNSGSYVTASGYLLTN